MRPARTLRLLATLAALALLAACPDAKVPKDPRQMPTPKAETPAPTG